MRVKDYIQDNILVFDGAMGTYFSNINKQRGAGCELSNLSQPSLIQNIHKEYIEAGAKAIKTNTFCANRIYFQGDEDLVKRVIRSAWENANIAKKEDTFVFADIGPIGDLSKKQKIIDEYKFVVDCFLECGAVNFLFETNTNTIGLKEMADYIQSKVEGFIICSFAISTDGFTRDGIHIHDIFDELKVCSSINSIGLNCVCGAYHMYNLVQQLDYQGITLSLMPNAGYPVVLNNRTFYEGDADYYASQIVNLVSCGASIIGGCCGTTPNHIKTSILRLKEINETEIYTPIKKEIELDEDNVVSLFWNKLQNKEKVIAVELDSPENSSVSKFMNGAKQLKEAGVDIITIADCPIGRARMDSSLLACKIQKELSIEALPHMTCRDRNLNATKALLMGLYCEGIRNVLLVTGDPIPDVQRDEVKSVYQFNSRKLAAYITSMSSKSLLGSFHLFGALNVNARNFDVQLRLAKEKLDNGMIGFLTQPVLTKEAFENLKRAKEELNCFILGGVIPIVSKRNGLFMNSEINGIEVDEKVIALYDNKTREEAEDIAVEVSCEIMKQIEPYIDGFYLMTPFGRTSLIERIISTYREKLNVS